MRYRHRVLGLLFLLSVITYLDRVAITYASSDIMKDLDLDVRSWGWVMSLFALSYAAFEIPSGWLGDKIGPRRVLTRIVIWWSIFTSLTGAVLNYWQLLLSRFLFGAGEAGAYPNAASAISRWFPKTERGRAQSVVWTASRVGGAVTPFIMIPVQALLGWRATFSVLGLIGLAWAAWWYVWYRDTPRENPLVTSEELTEIGAPELAKHEKLDWGVAMRSRNLWLIMLMYHLYCWGAYFYLSWLPTYLQNGRGFSKTELLWTTLPFIAGVFGNLLGGWLTDRLSLRYGLRIGRVSVGATGLALSAGCMLGAALTTDRFVALAWLTLGYGCMDCMLPVSWAVCLDVGRKYAGTISGAMNMAGQVGSFFMSTLFGYTVHYFHGDYNKPLIPMAGMLLASAVAYLFINPNLQVIPDRPGVDEAAAVGV
jgi:MFS transporter, ACS family, glucarate transporter